MGAWWCGTWALVHKPLVLFRHFECGPYGPIIAFCEKSGTIALVGMLATVRGVLATGWWIPCGRYWNDILQP